MYKLSYPLKKRYGKSKTYTAEQVKITAKILGLNEKYLLYGFALFCSKEVFFQNQKVLGADLNYQQLREEIGRKYFDGNAKFTTKDIRNLNPVSSFRNAGGIGDMTIHGGGESERP